MGQTVIIRDHVAVGDVLVVTTDRSFTGQDGQSMTPDSPGSAVPGLLAESLFDLDIGIDHLYVLQNTVTIRRSRPWDERSTRRELGCDLRLPPSLRRLRGGVGPGQGGGVDVVAGAVVVVVGIVVVVVVSLSSSWGRRLHRRAPCTGGPRYTANRGA